MSLTSTALQEDPDIRDTQFQPVQKGGCLPDGWTRGGSHPGRYDMGLDDGMSNDGSTSAAFICSLPSQRPRKNLGFGTICQKFYPKSYIGKRISLTGSLAHDLKGAESWTGLWVKVDLKTSTNTPRTFHLDNMADRKLVGFSNGKWTKCEIVTDVPVNVDSLTFGFLMVGEGIVWASDFKISVVDDTDEVQPTGITKKPRVGKDRDTIAQELQSGLRKLSLSSPSLTAPSLTDVTPSSSVDSLTTSDDINYV